MNSRHVEYEYDFSYLKCAGFTFNMSNTNLIPRASFSTGQQQGGARALGM